MRPSIVIPQYTKSAESIWLLRTCLNSIRRYEPELLAHTLVVEDCGPWAKRDSELEAVRQDYGCHLTRQPKNMGFSKTVNAGLMLSLQGGYDWALLLNNDVELIEPVSAAITNCFGQDELISVVGCQLLFPDGRIQHAGFSCSRGGAIDVFTAGEFYLPPMPSDVNRYSMGVTAALQAVHLGRSRPVGLYSTAYKLGYEDVEFCMRTWQRGRRVYYLGELKAVHNQSATRGFTMGEAAKGSLDQWLADAKKIDFDLLAEAVHSLGSAARNSANASS